MDFAFFHYDHSILAGGILRIFQNMTVIAFFLLIIIFGYPHSAKRF